MLFDTIKKLTDKQGISISTLEERVGLGKNTLYKWKTQSPKVETLQKVADYFDISTDYLLGRTEQPYYQLNEKEKNDIAVQADLLLEGIENGDNLNFYGEPASPEQKERIRVALRTAMEMNKEEAKKKFTAKKYRNE